MSRAKSFLSLFVIAMVYVSSCKSTTKSAVTEATAESGTYGTLKGTIPSVDAKGEKVDFAKTMFRVEYLREGQQKEVAVDTSGQFEISLPGKDEASESISISLRPMGQGYKVQKLGQKVAVRKGEVASITLKKLNPTGMVVRTIKEADEDAGISCGGTLCVGTKKLKNGKTAVGYWDLNQKGNEFSFKTLDLHSLSEVSAISLSSDGSFVAIANKAKIFLYKNLLQSTKPEIIDVSWLGESAHVGMLRINKNGIFFFKDEESKQFYLASSPYKRENCKGPYSFEELYISDTSQILAIDNFQFKVFNFSASGVEEKSGYNPQGYFADVESRLYTMYPNGIVLGKTKDPGNPSNDDFWVVWLSGAKQPTALVQIAEKGYLTSGASTIMDGTFIVRMGFPISKSAEGGLPSLQEDEPSFLSFSDTPGGFGTHLKDIWGGKSELIYATKKHLIFEDKTDQKIKLKNYEDVFED